MGILRRRQEHDSIGPRLSWVTPPGDSRRSARWRSSAAVMRSHGIRTRRASYAMPVEWRLATRCTSHWRAESWTAKYVRRQIQHKGHLAHKGNARCFSFVSFASFVFTQRCDMPDPSIKDFEAAIAELETIV